MEMDHTKDSAPFRMSHWKVYPRYLFLRLSFGELWPPSEQICFFFSSWLDRFAWHEGWSILILNIYIYSEMNSEGLIEHDHSLKSSRKFVFSFKFPTFHSKPHAILSSSSESSDVHCLIFAWHPVSVSPSKNLQWKHSVKDRGHRNSHQKIVQMII